jgi:Zn finger protein HypA/HybF involved in hydrogenase expression
MSKQEGRDAVAQSAGQVYEELQVWCEAHPRYTLMELEQQVVHLRQRLIGDMLSKIVAEREAVQPAEGVKCPKCQGVMQDKGRRKRTVQGPEGSVELDRAYYYCPSCEEGFSPSGPRVATDEAPLD